MELGSGNLILHFTLLGSIKLVKLAIIYIKVRAEGQPTTASNQSRARSIHSKDLLPTLWLLHFKISIGDRVCTPFFFYLPITFDRLNI